LLSQAGDTVSVREVLSGTFYLYVIGDSKEKVLNKEEKNSNSPRPKPKEYPRIG
jgi:hypothetical protein